MEIGLSLGSNLDHRLENLREATNRIDVLPGVQVLAKAPIYETAPEDVKPEYKTLQYLNTVVIIETDMDLSAFSEAIHKIETDMGRVRTEDRNAPRVIDIDVLYAGNITRADGILDLPHPRWAQRRFVVQPLADVRPFLKLPGESRQVSEILKSLPPTCITLFRAEHQW
ncbi:MAG: 2-amino-4-hydroxy-6-hydroxymethyldihydropteridine diphosphokinase [bacterium]|jgi:2-amino-4-hydroxy-6-hydroxymethyldihydropteridine diphosphokinase